MMQPVDMTDDVACRVETVQIDPVYLEEHSSEQVQSHKISSCLKVQQELEGESCEASLAKDKFQENIGIHFAKRQVSARAEFGGYKDCDHLI